MFLRIAYWIALPIALFGVFFATLTALYWFDGGIFRADLLVTTVLVAAASLAAFFVGYALRDV